MARAVLLVWAFLVAMAGTAWGEGKRAFVLGNADYAALPDLESTLFDAAAYRDALAGLGYEVSYHENLDLDGMAGAVDAFVASVAAGDRVVFVYSGHGWSDSTQNYLVPTDAPTTGADLKLKGASYPLRNGQDGVLDLLETSGAQLTVAIIDACRNNPFTPPKGRKSVGLTRGLVPIDAPPGTFLIYSAGEGQEALDRLPDDDGDQRLSVFSRSFVPLLASGMALEDAISEAQVATATLAKTNDGHVQTPAYYDQALGKTCLVEGCEIMASASKPAPFAAQTAPVPRIDFGDVKIGILLGFTGPLESITGPMAKAAEFALDEVNASGKTVYGMHFVALRGDSTCIDPNAATKAAEKLRADGVAGIVGADCSGATGAVLQQVARPGHIAMVSPSATSPTLSSADDDGLFFRVSASDAREGSVLSEILMERGIRQIAITYTDNDYGKGLSQSITSAFTDRGGRVTISAPHNDDKTDMTSEVQTLARAGGDLLVVAGYSDAGGKRIIEKALKTGAFSTFALTSGMYSVSLSADVGPELDGSFGVTVQPDQESAQMLAEAVAQAGSPFDVTAVFVQESYDSAALIMLAMQAAGSTESSVYAARIMDIANAPGQKIYAGQLGKAMELLAQGQDIDYEGATAVTMIAAGDGAGRYQEFDIKNGAFETARFR